MQDDKVVTMPRVHPSQTVALCGLKSDATHDDIKKVLENESLLPQHLEPSGIAPVIKDKSDKDTSNGRRLVFLNCKSKDAATKVCAALNRKKVKDLGMEKYGCELQAVLKNDLRSVEWKSRATETKTVEGRIAKKRNIDCFIDEPMRCHIMFSSDK